MTTEHDVLIDYPMLAHLGLVVSIHDPKVDRPISSCIDWVKVWESFQTRQIMALLEQPGFRAFYDLGANIGWHSLVAAAHLRDRGLSGQVIAVEPARANMACLSRSIARNRLGDIIRPIRAAVSDSEGIATLTHDAVNSGNHHLAAANWPFPADDGQEEVPLHRLDRLIRDNDWPAPSLIKIDVQGHEIEALTGLGDQLRAPDGLIVLIEYVPGAWRLEALLALVGPDGLYHLDDQSRRIVPTSAGRLQEIAADWPRGYFDLILTRGATAERAVRGLPDWTDQAQMRFGAGFEGLMEHEARWVGAEALCRVDPLAGAGSSEVRAEVHGRVLRQMRPGEIVLEVGDADGTTRSQRLEPGVPFSAGLHIGPGPAWLRFRLHETPGGRQGPLEAAPVRAFQLSHLDLRIAPRQRP